MQTGDKSKEMHQFKKIFDDRHKNCMAQVGRITNGSWDRKVYPLYGKAIISRIDKKKNQQQRNIKLLLTKCFENFTISKSLGENDS